MKYSCLIILMVLLSIPAFGQNAYYETDSSLIVGIKLIDSGDKINARICQVKSGDSIITYSPWQVKSYGFAGGPEFISQEIQLGDSTTKVFLQRLHKGETSLYYYRGKGIKTYFVKKDSLFIEVAKRDSDNVKYNDLLLQITEDCPHVVHAINHVNYTQRALSRLIERYNYCEPKPFPRYKYGMTLGYEFSRVTPPAEFGYDFNHHTIHNGGVSFGLFFNHPIFMSYFSLQTEMLFSQQGHSYYQVNPAEHLHVSMQMSSLQMPLLIRYSLPTNNIRPFINTGAILSYSAIKESSSFRADISNNIVSINKPIEISIMSKNHAGYLAGLGLEYDLDYKKSVFIEMRYSRQFSILQNEPASRNSAIFITSGISF